MKLSSAILLRKLTVDVNPASVFPHKTADFMQAMGATANAITRYEFNCRAVCCGHGVAFDFQTDPFASRFSLEIELRRPRARVPACQQIGLKFEGVGAVARTHERFSRCSGLPLMQRLTA